MNRLLAILLLFATLATPVSATSIFDLMATQDPHTPLEMTVTLPLDSLMRLSKNDQPARLNFTAGDGSAQVWDLKVSTRGKFRRARCEMPPLKFNFSKKELRAAGLEDHDKYKLVLPCFENELGHELITREYLAYQAYQLLTPFSFRTQLLKLTVIDADDPQSVPHVVTAFIIEDTDEMAHRNGAREAEELPVGQAAEIYAPEAEATHALFQYLVGNGDWSLLLQRNVKLLRTATDEIVPVGYDFDFSGWVGAPYSTPSRDAGQESIYERVYLGYAQSDDVVAGIIAKFKEQRRPILKLINESDISYEGKQVTARFAARFFAAINRVSSSRDLTLYDQLRGETAAVIPAGEAAGSFQSMGR